MSAAGSLESLSSAEIDGVATLWKRERREFTTSFSGISMLPAIAPGQPVTVRCGMEPMVGDVAVFRYDNQVGVHRVVARTTAWLLTWGDNNPLPDEPIVHDLVIGVIRDVAPGPKSLRRKLLLWFLRSRRQPIERLTRRVRRVYRVRSVWEQGPLVFAATSWRALLRRVLPN
jgi:hypothetical protein